MRFMLLMLDGGLTRGWPDDRWLAAYGRMMRWSEELEARGIRPIGEPLRPDVEGARVRARDGATLVTDGPFPETKEVVGGFTIVDGVTRDEAVAIAASCPAAEWATVEVREIRVVQDPRRT